MLVLIWLFVLVRFRDACAGYIEIVEITACRSCRIMLTCRELDAIIAILEADYSGNANVTKSGVEETVASASPFPFVHPRESLNQRCSGLNHCSFILSEDCPGCEQLDNKDLTVKYACVTGDQISRYCNSEISVPPYSDEGFILNPGYPRFYAGQRICRWRISARSDQKIRITLLDVALIEEKPSTCSDTLIITDSEDNVILSECRQRHPPEEVVIGGGSVEVLLKADQELNPRRGVMIRYRVEGCPRLDPPMDAYIIARTENTVVFSCCLGYHFPDTGTRVKTVKCLGARWNVTLPLSTCQKSNLQQYNQTSNIRTREKVTRISMSSELIAPIVIIIALFAINGAVMFFIFRAKKKNALEHPDDEELGALSRPTK